MYIIKFFMIYYSFKELKKIWYKHARTLTNNNPKCTVVAINPFYIMKIKMVMLMELNLLIK